jgi:hypothetical protein
MRLSLGAFASHCANPRQRLSDAAAWLVKLHAAIRLKTRAAPLPSLSAWLPHKYCSQPPRKPQWFG